MRRKAAGLRQAQQDSVVPYAPEGIAIRDSIRAFQKLLPPCLPRRKPPVCSQAQSSVSWIRRLPEGGSGRAESHPACMKRDNSAAGNSPLMGSDAPTPARIGTGRPMGRSIASGGEPKGTGGNGGKRVSSGYNRRRRLATRSSGKQQAERTAVRTAPIVCPEESPQCARRRKPLPPQGLTRRLRRG